MIFNIVDHRKNNKKFEEVWGVIEPTENDNCCKGADQVEYTNRSGFVYFSKKMKYHDLIKWASGYNGKNTLYVYDKDPSICVKYEEK